jgi:heparan-alpha-glucosaminide N-acetyltransferase
LFGAVLFFNVYPKAVGSFWPTASKVIGLLLLGGMLAIFRRSDGHGRALWLDFSYWEILGIIGWTYLATCALYVPVRRWRGTPVLWLVLLCAFNMAAASHVVQFPNRLPLYVWPWSNGAFAILTLSGTITADVLLTDRWADSLAGRAKLTSGFGAILLLTGWASSPLGISKIRATPTWCLVSAGSSVFLFLLLYWICDVHRRTRWASFVRPAGTNTLLTYLLPDFFFFGVSLAWLPQAWDYGFAGVLRAAAFTALMLLLSAALTRCRVRLQL